MRAFPFSLLWLCLLMQLTACQENPGTVLRAGLAPTQSGSLGFSTVSFERRSEGCTEDAACARLLAVYPKADSGPGELVALVNDSILMYLRLSMSVFSTGPQQIAPDLDSIAREFILAYERFRLDVEENAPPWTVECKGKVLYQSPRVLSVELDNFSFTGGAHPNSFKVLLVFDLASRKLLELEDLIAEKEKFADLVESAFRRHYQLEEGESLHEAGFFWDEPFFLPANGALTERGLALVYNPYEAAPYVVGSTELDIPYHELEGILRKEYFPPD